MRKELYSNSYLLIKHTNVSGIFVHECSIDLYQKALKFTMYLYVLQKHDLIDNMQFKSLIAAGQYKFIS